MEEAAKTREFAFISVENPATDTIVVVDVATVTKSETADQGD